MAYDETLTWAKVATAVGGEARLKRFFPGETSGNHPKFTDAVEAASLMIDERLAGVVTLPLSEPLSPLMFGYAAALILSLGTINAADEVPKTVSDAYDRAIDYLEDIRKGRVTLTDTDTADAGGVQLPAFSSSHDSAADDFLDGIDDIFPDF